MREIRTSGSSAVLKGSEREAVEQRPTMKFVANKTLDQLDLQALHLVREWLVGHSAPPSSTRYAPSCWSAWWRCGRDCTSCAPNCPPFSPNALTSCRHACCTSSRDWLIIGISSMRASKPCPTRLVRWPVPIRHADRLMSVPIIASAMVATIGDGSAFSKGRDFGAWLGLLPKQISTGDRTILGSISKRGNRYLRALFAQAAWVVLARVLRAGDCARQQARPYRQFSTKGAPSSARRPMRRRPDLLDPRAPAWARQLPGACEHS
jgi:transposase